MGAILQQWFKRKIVTDRYDLGINHQDKQEQLFFMYMDYIDHIGTQRKKEVRQVKLYILSPELENAFIMAEKGLQSCGYGISPSKNDVNLVLIYSVDKSQDTKSPMIIDNKSPTKVYNPNGIELSGIEAKIANTNFIKNTLINFRATSFH